MPPDTMPPEQKLALALNNLIFEHFHDRSARLVTIDTARLAKALGCVAGCHFAALKTTSFNECLTMIAAMAKKARREFRNHPAALPPVIEVPPRTN